MTARTFAFAAPIGLSAFLLFTVEPLVGRLALPIFGGTPAVWATTLFFFQAVLLAGYLYAHVSVTWFGRWGPPIHVGLACLGIVALLLAPARVATIGVDGLTPALGVVVLLGAVIGLPAFLLTTTTPLLSSWFANVRGGKGDDPYWLYALSNGGSLLALLAYPLVIEPRLGLTDQRGIWLVGFVGPGRAPGAGCGARHPGDQATRLGRRGQGEGPGDHRCPTDRCRASPALDPAGGHPVRPAVGRDHVHRDGPRVRAAPVGLAAGHLPRVPSSSRSRRADSASSRRRSWRHRPWSRCCGCRSARRASGPSSRSCCWS